MYISNGTNKAAYLLVIGGLMDIQGQRENAVL